MSDEPIPKDVSGWGDLAVICLLIGVPVASLGIENASRGIFADVLRPLISPDTISVFIPKLGKDLAFYAEKWPHLDPEPYLYWYFATLVICTVMGLLMIPRTLRVVEKPERRQTMVRHWNRGLRGIPWRWLPAKTSAKLMIFVIVIGCMIIVSITFLGPVQFGRRITVGLIHDVYMTSILICYGAVVCGVPGILKVIAAHRRESRAGHFD